MSMIFAPNRKLANSCFAICGLCLLFLFACKKPASQLRSDKPEVTPRLSNEREVFRGVDVAPRQVLIKMEKCDGIDSGGHLVEGVTRFAREATNDESATATRATNGCWFKIRSSTLTVERLLTVFRQSIETKRAVTINGLTTIVVDADPNHLIHINPPAGDQPIIAPVAPTPIAVPSATPVATPSGTLAGGPNDTYYQADSLWGLKNPTKAGMDINAENAWTRSTGSPDIVVGVIDTGIYYNHPDLIKNVWSAPSDYQVTVKGELITCPEGSHGYNAVPLTFSEICDPLDQTYNSGHGTHVSGIIGAVGNNAEGVVGVNWNTKLVGLKVVDIFNSVEMADVVSAIEFATQLQERWGAQANVRVLNASIGFLGPGVPASDLSMLKDEIEFAGTKNILLVASAGENDNDNDQNPHYPSGFDLPNVLSVTAIDSSGALAKISGSLSNHGVNSVHLGAPGKSIYSTYPVSLGDSYYVKSGTSMAAPFVSGAAALMLSVPPCSALSAADLKTKIVGGVDITPSLTQTKSKGRLNVAKAIDLCGP